jgi:hypothetical protein
MKLKGKVEKALTKINSRMLNVYYFLSKIINLQKQLKILIKPD